MAAGLFLVVFAQLLSIFLRQKKTAVDKHNSLVCLVIF